MCVWYFIIQKRKCLVFLKGGRFCRSGGGGGFGIRDVCNHNYLKNLKIKFSRKEDILSNIPTLIPYIKNTHIHTHLTYLPHVQDIESD